MSRLATPLLKWYALNARRLPWRGKKRPYEVWVSEIMLQQTRVGVVVPYYRRWMARFPTIGALARATERDVLRQWEGLGYYARARNLHRAAKVVLEKYGGRLPSKRQDLLGLPGIGEYTAGAISSIAFGRREAVLDGNVLRVLARVFEVTERVDSAAGSGTLWKLAEAQLPQRRAGEFNQAMMDLGATVCLPARPRCGVCPLTAACEAYRLGVQDSLPVRAPRKRVPHHVLGAVVVMSGGRVLLSQRQSRGLLGGMWQFPSGTLNSGADASRPLEAPFINRLRQSYGIRLRQRRLLGTIRHAYTHFRVTVHAYTCETRISAAPRGLTWIRISDLDNYPMGRVDRRIADMLRG